MPIYSLQNTALQIDQANQYAYNSLFVAGTGLARLTGNQTISGNQIFVSGVNISGTAILASDSYLQNVCQIIPSGNGNIHLGSSLNVFNTGYFSGISGTNGYFNYLKVANLDAVAAADLNGKTGSNVTLSGTTRLDTLVASGSVYITGDAYITGALNVGGNSELKNITAVGNLVVTGGGRTFSGTLFQTGLTSISGDTTIYGETNIQGNLKIKGGNLTLTGNSFLTGNKTILGSTFSTGRFFTHSGEFKAFSQLFPITLDAPTISIVGDTTIDASTVTLDSDVDVVGALDVGNGRLTVGVAGITVGSNNQLNLPSTSEINAQSKISCKNIVNTGTFSGQAMLLSGDVNVAYTLTPRLTLGKKQLLSNTSNLNNMTKGGIEYDGLFYLTTDCEDISNNVNYVNLRTTAPITQKYTWYGGRSSVNMTTSNTVIVEDDRKLVLTKGLYKYNYTTVIYAPNSFVSDPPATFTPILGITGLTSASKSFNQIIAKLTCTTGTGLINPRIITYASIPSESISNPNKGIGLTGMAGNCEPAYFSPPTSPYLYGKNYYEFEAILDVDTTIAVQPVVRFLASRNNVSFAQTYIEATPLQCKDTRLAWALNDVSGPFFPVKY